MSRRHRHHMQPYDYERFGNHSRGGNQTSGIEYQDDSLSSINSDEESYLHHIHSGKDKKSSYYSSKNEPRKPELKVDKPSDNHFQNEAKPQPHGTIHVDNTSDRLSRLESMLEQLIKHKEQESRPQTPPAVLDKPSPSDNFVAPVVLDSKRNKFTTSLWINKIQETAVQSNWDEKTTIQYMESQMSGIVKAWYKCLANYDLTWPEWKMLIAQVFPDNVDFITTLKRLVTRLKRADENVTSYYFSKMYLIDACKITGEDAVSCLIDGLNNQAIQEKAKSQNFLTPEMLYSQFLINLPEYNVDYTPTVEPQPHAQGVWDQWYSYYQEQNEGRVVEEKAGPSDDPYQYSNEQNEEQNYHDVSNSEFVGNEEDMVHGQGKRSGPIHTRLDTRYIKPNHFKHNKLPMAAKICSHCFNRGHLAKHCRKLKQLQYCKLNTKECEQCLYKDCLVNGRKLDAFVDTGCNTVTLREYEASRLELDVRPASDFIEAYGGGHVKVVGETEILLELDSVKRPLRATVVPNSAQKVSVIIGQSFLNQKNVCMILQNNTLRVLEASQGPIN